MITAVSFNNIIPVVKRQTNCTIPRLPQYSNGLNCDTISFTSKTLPYKSSKEITKVVKKAIKEPENFIGKGGEGEVYKIPDTDYCVKILYYSNLKKIGEWTNEISSADKVNHVVAKSENGTTIMKYIEGEPLSWQFKPDEVYSLPDKSFKDLANQITEARDEEMIFDNAASNIIFNHKTQSLTAIDFYPPEADDNYICRPLTMIYSALKPHAGQERDIKMDKKLGNKLLNIVLDEVSPNKQPDIEISPNDINTLLYKIYQDSKFARVPQYKFLIKSMNKIFELKEAEEIGVDVEKELNGQIKYSRCIVNQVFSE